MNPNDSTSETEQQAPSKWQEVTQYLISYFKNPIQGVRKLPDWDWLTLFFVHTAAAALCGTLAGLIDQSLRDTLAGFIVLPLSSTFLVAVFAGFFHYVFLFFFKKEIPFKKIVTLIVLANLPFMAVYTLHLIVPPIKIFGFAVTAMLLIVGIVDSFQMPRKPIVRLVAAVWGIYLLMWVANMIGLPSKRETERFKATPESLDILQKELKTD